jgi:hypothetical protein
VVYVLDAALALGGFGAHGALRPQCQMVRHGADLDPWRCFGELRLEAQLLNGTRLAHIWARSLVKS